MNMKKALAASIVASAVSLAVSNANQAQAMDADKEKCYGVVKAGQNDCGDAAKTHSCMGHAAKDGDNNEWVAVPKGLCEKLVGGSLTAGQGGAHSCEGKGSCEGKNGCEGKDKEG